MSEFLRYVLYELKNSLVLVLLAGILVAGGLMAAFFIHKKKYNGQKKFPWGKVVLWLILLCYLAVVLYATTFRSYLGHRSVNLHLFRSWREAWNNFSQHRWLNVLLNIAMFGPLGFLLPLLNKKFQKWYWTIPAGLCASLGIEMLQFILACGVCDIDDLFCNTLGTVIGYFLIMTILSLLGKNGKRLKPGLAYGCLTLTSVMAVCSVFIIYELKEYGNLPNAAAYTSNTRGTVWILDCELPTAEAEIAVYRTQTRSIEDCDAFAEDFKQIINAEYNTISYYQDAAYYMDNDSNDGAHFLYVNYLNQGYEYSAIYDDDAAWISSDRETIEAAISHLPVFIPEYAEFEVAGNGWHIFTVDQHVDGAVMVDGILRCRYAEDGTVREVENNLLSYTYYDKVIVISPEEAYARLCNGEGGYFGRIPPSEVSVLSCRLQYEIDTKGFYQPVYIFEILIPETGTLLAMIPAMQ